MENSKKSLKFQGHGNFEKVIEHFEKVIENSNKSWKHRTSHGKFEKSWEIRKSNGNSEKDMATPNKS